MTFKETKLAGVFEIEITPIVDERGFFARSWCREEFIRRGLNGTLSQSSISFNPQRGTFRGMHWQAAPFAEAKLVRCTQGSICDVALDLRTGSPTFKDWTAVTLSALNRRMLYIPEGCAHGFLTLQNDTEVFYQISELYNPQSGRGVRWNDPAFGIQLPESVTVISKRDSSYTDFV